MTYNIQFKNAKLTPVEHDFETGERWCFLYADVEIDGQPVNLHNTDAENGLIQYTSEPCVLDGSPPDTASTWHTRGAEWVTSIDIAQAFLGGYNPMCWDHQSVEMAIDGALVALAVEHEHDAREHLARKAKA